MMKPLKLLNQRDSSRLSALRMTSFTIVGAVREPPLRHLVIGCWLC